MVIGANGLVGSNFIKFFENKKNYNILKISRQDLDLKNEVVVSDYFKSNKPDIVIFAAANVGGIQYNINYPVDLILDNLQITSNVVSAALKVDVSKFINFGCSCMYPVNAELPLNTQILGEGPVEKTSEFYAQYKLASWKIIEAINSQYNKSWITIIPSTIYGPFDNFSTSKGHVISSLINKFHSAKLNNLKEVTLFGDGTPLREFIYVNDLVQAIKIILENNILTKTINIGSSHEIEIKDLANLIKSVVEYEGEIIFDLKQSNGAHRKLLDSSLIRNLGWTPKTPLEIGLKTTYDWYKNFISKARN